MFKSYVLGSIPYVNMKDTDKLAYPHSSNSAFVVAALLGDFFFISWFTDPPTQIFAF